MVKNFPWVRFLFLHVSICLNPNHSLIPLWIFWEFKQPSASVSNLQRWTDTEGSGERRRASAFSLPFCSLLFLLRGFFTCRPGSGRFLLPWGHDVGGGAGAGARPRGRGGAACRFAGVSESQKTHSEKTYSAETLIKNERYWVINDFDIRILLYWLISVLKWFRSVFLYIQLETVSLYSLHTADILLSSIKQWTYPKPKHTKITQ